MELDLGIEMEISGKFYPFDIVWSWEVSCGPVSSNLALPPQRHSLDTWLEHQEPVIHTTQNKREIKKKEDKIK